MELVNVVQAIKDYFNREDIKPNIKKFAEENKDIKNWSLFSDYCLDDKNKPNNVMTFILMPYISNEYMEEIKKTTQDLQPCDIKHTKEINPEYLKFIKSKEWLSFSVIIEDRNWLAGRDDKEKKDNIEKILKLIKQDFITWRDNEDNEKLIKKYEENYKNFDKILHEIFKRKISKNLIDIFLVTIIGVTFVEEILGEIKNIKRFGWFSDRDKIVEDYDNLASELFFIFLYNRLKERNLKYYTWPSGKVEPFCEEFNRIADIICGTWADLNFNTGEVGDKFEKVFHGLIEDNPNIMVFRILKSEEVG